MFLTDNPEPRNEDPDDRPSDRTVFTRGRPAPALAWQAPCPPRDTAAAPIRRRVLVPVHTGPGGVEVVRFFKDPVGRRVGVAFTSVARLRNVCGTDQHWTEMAEECLRETIAGLGVETVVHDPRLTAAPVASPLPGEPKAPTVPPSTPRWSAA